jgi:endoglucanase
MIISSDLGKRSSRVRSFAFVSLLACLALGAPAKTAPLTADTVLREMAPGWNLGDALESIPKETSWGNPIATDALLRGVKAAGFKSVRIPVAWSQYADAENCIDPKWMAHVTDVVKKARRAGLYAILNIHWDGGWMQPTYAQQAQVDAKLSKFWTQIATNFKSFDDHLLFAGTNEVMVTGVYRAPTAENAAVQNGFNQTFVDAVRATGGRNATRFLIVQAYNTNIDYALESNAELPKDTATGRLMMEVHYYDPYDFTINERSSVWQWGSKATDPAATETWANEAYVDAQFQKMKSAFVDKGVPVILGEYASAVKPRFPGMKAYCVYWDGYVTRSAVQHNLVPFFWDAGGPGGLFNRTTGKPQDPEVIEALVGAAK